MHLVACRKLLSQLFASKERGEGNQKYSVDFAWWTKRKNSKPSHSVAVIFRAYARVSLLIILLRTWQYYQSFFWKIQFCNSRKKENENDFRQKTLIKTEGKMTILICSRIFSFALLLQPVAYRLRKPLAGWMCISQQLNEALHVF